jgi:rSAM/selenodomain-associated transferase 2
MLSIIIPTLNEAASINRLLAALAKMPEPLEVIVVDGGSEDDTVRLVRERGLRLIESERGRGTQMHAGECVSCGEVLWFLHADTIPSPDAINQILHSLRDPRVVGGNFDVHFDGHRLAARFLTWTYRQLRHLGLCYGDSAIFVRRESYERAGGFKGVPIFEDLDLVRRLRRIGRFIRLSSRVTTSARRFEGRSFALTFARWTFLQILYWLGVSPHRLNRLYAPIRDARV